MMAGFADSMGSQNALGYHDGGNLVQSGADSWFQSNCEDTSSAATAILQNDDQFGGLDFLLASAGLWGSTFAGENDGSEWGMYDMMNEIRNDGEWDMFGQSEDGSYINATESWFSDWINSQNSGWSNEDWLKEYMTGSDSYMTLFNATHDVPLLEEDEPITFWINTTEYPVDINCLKDVCTEDIIEYFNAVGKPIETVNQVSSGLKNVF